MAVGGSLATVRCLAGTSHAAAHTGSTASEKQIHKRLRVCLDGLIKLRLASLKHLHELLVESRALKDSLPKLCETRV